MSVYCLVEEGSSTPIKIGFTKGKIPRISNTHNPRRIVAVNFFEEDSSSTERDLEAYLHTKFEDKRVGGGGTEWFAVLIEEVNAAVQFYQQEMAAGPITFAGDPVTFYFQENGRVRFYISKKESEHNISKKESEHNIRMFERLAIRCGTKSHDHGTKDGRFEFICAPGAAKPFIGLRMRAEFVS